MKRLIISALAVAAFSSGAAFALPSPVILNPSATNGGAFTLSLAQGPFTTDNLQGTFSSVLDVTTRGLGATSAFNESGNFSITGFQLNNGPTFRAGINQNIPGGTWDLVARFSLSGTGIWDAGLAAQFNVGPFFPGTSLSTFTAELFGIQTGGTFTSATPTSGTDATGGLTLTAGFHKLGDLTLIPGLGTQATATATGGIGGQTSLNALLAFTPLGGVSGPLTGVGGVFQDPSPWAVNFGAGAIVNQNSASVCGVTNAPVFAPPCPGGVPAASFIVAGTNGSANFSTNYQIPEPGTLALLGGVLVALGATGVRRKAS